MGVDVKQADGDTDQIAADHIGRQRPKRQGHEEGIERHAEQPARPCAQGSTCANGDKVEGSKILQGAHRGNCSRLPAAAG